MAGILLERFGGQLPAWDDSLLPPGQATIAINTELTNGALLGWRVPKLLRPLTDPNAKFVYRVPTVTEYKASAYLIFVANANQGDTVKLGEQVYTFTATVTNPYDVLLGATATDSAANLFAALTETGTPGTTYGIGTTYNPNIEEVAADNTVDTVMIGASTYPRITVVAPEEGAAYNATVVTESTSNARMTWLSNVASLSNTTPTFTGGTNPSFDADITGAATWMEFADADTAVMRSPVVNDQFDRYYIMSPSLPPRYNTYDRIVAGSEPWLLGVPAPGCAPIISVSGGGDDVVLGYESSSNAFVAQMPGNMLYMFKVTPEAALQLDDVSFISTDTNEEVLFSAVLYSDDNGVPDELLGNGAIIQGVTAGATQTSPFVNPRGLLANVTYWIGLIADGPIHMYNGGVDGLANMVQVPATFSNGPPLHASGAVGGQYNLQIYANLTSSAVLASRSYVYTWVTEYGEEGPPSPFELVNGWSNGVWNISLYTPALDDMGVVRNITKTRIYRTAVSQTGLAAYYFVAEVPVSQAVYVDEAQDDTITLNSELESTNWFEPPEGLQGLVGMPNGMAAAFRDNEVWFCEPFHPHAWPPNYVLTTEFPIIGLGVVGSTLVVATAAQPYIMTGSNSASMTSDKKAVTAPCISRASIVSLDDGVLYSSPNGLIRISEGGEVKNLTDSWVTEPKWRQLTPPRNLRAIKLVSDYLCYGSVNDQDTEYAQQGFVLETTAAINTNSFTPTPQVGGHRVGFVQMEAPNDLDIQNLLVDPWAGIGLTIQAGNVYYWDFADPEPEHMVYRWRSKTYTAKFKENYAAFRVFFNIPASTPEQNPYRKEDPTDDESWDTLDEDRYAYLKVYADNVLVTVREIRNNKETLRILSGFKADHWHFEILSRVEITEVQVATSVKQLRKL